ncbi:MAG: thiamine-phosphate pyrophosphorylase [Candidatus Omnitrophica bacterium]|nr:thiamine-phosphate pyrophosphorylase [Candidatus Omnitrophota bacterium]
MLKQAKGKSINRIIDANINRAKEGLRVCEDITRFIFDNREFTLKLKKIRHKVSELSSYLAPRIILLQERHSIKDVGRFIKADELKRKGVRDIFFANMQRAKESIRVLEEFSKLVNLKAAIGFKDIRYKIYDIEKKVLGKG